MIKLLILIFLLLISSSSKAQMGGIGISIPPGTNHVPIINSGSIPSGAIQDDSGNYLQDDARHYLIAG